MTVISAADRTHGGAGKEESPQRKADSLPIMPFTPLRRRTINFTAIDDSSQLHPVILARSSLWMVIWYAYYHCRYDTSDTRDDNIGGVRQ